MFQRLVASTNLGHGVLEKSTQPGPQNSAQGHTVLLSCRVPALSGDTVACGWVTAGLAGGTPGFSVLLSFAFKAFFGVSEIEFPSRSFFASVSYAPKCELLSRVSTIMGQKTRKELVSCRRTVHRGLLRGETCLELRILGCFELTGMYSLSASMCMDREATDRTQDHNPMCSLQSGQG